jgi:ketosteroid isomerase-like protein
MVWMNRILLAIISLTFLNGCTSSIHEEPNQHLLALKDDLLESDRHFSKMSEEAGLRAAYMEYIDSNVVLLKPNSLPITSGNAIDFITQINDVSQTMTWVPKSGFVANSGDLGYTYGLYSIRSRTTDSARFGTYLNVWKRQADSTWKLVMSSANEGIE